MSKRSRLPEKPTRIPNPRDTEWRDLVFDYFEQLPTLNTESARSHRFASLVHSLLGFEPTFIESFYVGIERSITTKGKDRLLRGEVDNLFGNVVIEFESDLSRKRKEAEEQLRRYISILWADEPPDSRTPFLCISTDGANFITYTPLAPPMAGPDLSPDKVTLQLLEATDWRTLGPTEIYYWLDRYFLRREILHPTSEAIVADFGLNSHSFRSTTHLLLTLCTQMRTSPSFDVIYDSWEKYLRVVYGSSIAAEDLFARHTYLATLAKLMSWIRISDLRTAPLEAEIIEMLEGRLFDALGIRNYIEEDFFSWLARPEAARVAVSIVRWLFSLLRNYNLNELSEDVLKSLYQELVDPEARHDLGEFYTPDWLAHRLVNAVLAPDPSASVLDPACGSGTFLYLAIREKRELLGDSLRTLAHVLDSVVGVDIHPLAVTVAKTNYILALGDLLQRRKGPVSIPVYLSDSLNLPQREVTPTLWMRVPSYRVKLEGHEVHLPEPLLSDPPLFDNSIDLTKSFAIQHAERDISPDAFSKFLAAQHFPMADDPSVFPAMLQIAKTLAAFIRAQRDTIWAFILKNIYKPLFFGEAFDCVIGNPPWLAYHYIQQPTYQEFVKSQITETYKLLSSRGHLAPHLELATLFFVHAARTYLKPGGLIGFVLPRSVFTADQHDALRQRTFTLGDAQPNTLNIIEIWDCEAVTPLFRVPACVLIAHKAPPTTPIYPVPAETIAGKLPRKNASLPEAEAALSFTPTKLTLHVRGTRSYLAPGESRLVHPPSPYKRRFAEGATIFPRSFWLVDVTPSSLGFDPQAPLIQTSASAQRLAKDAYASVFLRGQAEAEFLYTTLLSTDLLPFGHFLPRLVLLPIRPSGDHYELLDSAEARRRGFIHLAKWLEHVQHEWETRRGEKAEAANALDWLNYRSKLTQQNPAVPHYVLYNTSGTHLTASLVLAGPDTFQVGSQSVATQGFIAESVTYAFATNDMHEAAYLAAVLNSSVLNLLLKPLQARGLWGPRHIHKKVLDLPIPTFNPEHPAHNELAQLGDYCSAAVSAMVHSSTQPSPSTIGRLRASVRQRLSAQMARIDELVTLAFPPDYGAA